MPNPQDIFQLAQQTATQVTASPENWRRFLYTAAHNYHTTYLNQLLIHAQRPDATACATMKYWNEQAHRKVMYGSKSIIILQRHQGVPTAKRVFSMTDTVLTGDKAAAPWEVTDAIRPLLMQVNSVGSLMDRATEQVVSLSDRANRVLATSIEDSTGTSTETAVPPVGDGSMICPLPGHTSLTTQLGSRTLLATLPIVALIFLPRQAHRFWLPTVALY